MALSERHQLVRYDQSSSPWIGKRDLIKKHFNSLERENLCRRTAAAQVSCQCRKKRPQAAHKVLLSHARSVKVWWRHGRFINKLIRICMGRFSNHILCVKIKISFSWNWSDNITSPYLPFKVTFEAIWRRFSIFFCGDCVCTKNLERQEAKCLKSPTRSYIIADFSPKSSLKRHPAPAQNRTMTRLLRHIDTQPINAVSPCENASKSSATSIPRSSDSYAWTRKKPLVSIWIPTTPPQVTIFQTFVQSVFTDLTRLGTIVGDKTYQNFAAWL